MTTAIEKLTEAVAKVRCATGNKSVFASVEVGGHINEADSVVFSVYRLGRNHDGATLDEAVAAAIAFDDKAERISQAAALRARAAELEAGAK